MTEATGMPLAIAKKIETRGMGQYSVLAHMMQGKEWGAIFVFMADQAKRHYKLFNFWQRNRTTTELPGDTISGMAKDALDQLAGHFLNQNFVPPVNYELYSRPAYDHALPDHSRLYPAQYDGRLEAPAKGLAEENAP